MILKAILNPKSGRRRQKKTEKDRRLSGLNIAIKNRYSENIGLKSGNSEEPLTIRGGEDIITFLLREDVQATLNANYKEIQDDIAKRCKFSISSL